MEFRVSLARCLIALGRQPETDILERLEAHRDLLLAWTRTAALVSAADASPTGLLRHYLESLQALPHLGAAPGRNGPALVVDLGSGGGFPGLIWVLAGSPRTAILVEAATRKAAFLREAVRELGLEGVEVRQERMEDPAVLTALGGRILTSRAAAAADLMLEAASLSLRDEKISHRDDLVLVLYPGAAAAGRIRAILHDGLVLSTDEPLISGARGRMMVWRGVPKAARRNPHF